MQKGMVTSRGMRRCVRNATMILIAAMLVISLSFYGVRANGQTEKGRVAKTKVAAVYPDLARRANIAGTVKVQVVVARNGQIKDSRPIGGNAVLVKAAMEAVKQWKFEPASSETTEVLEFKFQP